LPVLIPLLSCDNPIIRDGVQSILQSGRIELVRKAGLNANHWTYRQFGIDHALSELSQVESLQKQASFSDRNAAREQFRKYSL
jgi:hypothetical protein